MLSQDYFYYVFKVLEAGLPSIPGFIAALLIIIAVIIFARQRFTSTTISNLPIFLCLLLSVVALFFAFYGGIYEYDENPESLTIANSRTGTPDCGTGWTGWTKGGYGTGNPCPRGCYRGLTQRKQLSMSGFPPWPLYKRELQCWSYDK